jgi:maleylacetate reductase
MSDLGTFTYAALPNRVVFGSGTRARLPDEVRALGAKRVLLLGTPSQRDAADALAGALGSRAAGRFDGAVLHTPVHVTDQAVAHALALRADCVVAIGGGSVIGLAKAIALRTGMPQVAIPTTYSGSETTPILGETRGGEKATQRAMEVLPAIVIYDVDLTLTLPAALSSTSGVNALAHAVEALYARDRNPVTSLLAEEAVRVLASGLPRIVTDPNDRDARSAALYGAWLAGTCLAAVGMALHHKLAHVLGGAFGLPDRDGRPAVSRWSTRSCAAGAGQVRRSFSGPDAERDGAGARGLPQAGGPGAAAGGEPGPLPGHRRPRHAAGAGGPRADAGRRRSAAASGRRHADGRARAVEVDVTRCWR